MVDNRIRFYSIWLTKSEHSPLYDLKDNVERVIIFSNDTGFTYGSHVGLPTDDNGRVKNPWEENVYISLTHTVPSSNEQLDEKMVDKLILLRPKDYNAYAMDELSDDIRDKTA